jgi:hypothetical protein
VLPLGHRSQMMLFFFFVETQDEEGELFLQAMLVFSAPAAGTDRHGEAVYLDGTDFQTHSLRFWGKSLVLDIFLGLRFYFVASIAVASGMLIMMSVRAQQLPWARMVLRPAAAIPACLWCMHHTTFPLMRCRTAGWPPRCSAEGAIT